MKYALILEKKKVPVKEKEHKLVVNTTLIFGVICSTQRKCQILSSGTHCNVNLFIHPKH